MHVIRTTLKPARHGERGQVLPLWIVAIITAFTLMFLGLNYANTIRWQIRAQNAADSAAAAVISIQTQRFNEESIMMYTSAIEEIRLRHLLDGIVLALSGSGGCTGMPNIGVAQIFTASGGTTCEQVYSDLRTPFLQSVNRYTTDVGLLNSISYFATLSNFKADATTILNHISSSTYCNQANASPYTPDGGDCAMKYTLNGTSYRSAANGYPLGPVKFDANTEYIPGVGQTPNSWTGGNDSENPNLFAPAMADIVTCAKVPPLIPAFGNFKFPTYYAIGRAGATAAPVTGDWMQPGGTIDPGRGTSPAIAFQPPEHYTAVDSTQTLDSYGMNFNNWTFGTTVYQEANGTQYPGYTATATPNYTFNMVWMPWWGVLPIDPRAVDTNAITIASDC
jgi:hypothetical protein